MAIDLGQFIRGYTECALWSSRTEDDVPFDQVVGELAPEAVERMRADCADFVAANAEDLAEAERLGRPSDHLGHDFWLTRNGHGTGFWDRGPESVWKRLTENTRPYGGVDLYLGDDGKIYNQ